MTDTPIAVSLPGPTTTHLAGSPLELVVCQVQHDKALTVAGPGTVLMVRDGLTEVFKERLLIEENGQQAITPVGMSSSVPLPGQAEHTSGWRLRPRAGAWTIVLMPDFFALECTGYTTWAAFHERFKVLAELVASGGEPTIEKRLGLRYVDRMRWPRARAAASWRGFIDEHLLGPVLSEKFGSAMLGGQQVLHLLAPDSNEVLLRHGPQRNPDGTWHYILDADCYRVTSNKLEATSMLAGADALHDLALQVFQASVTPEFLSMLEEGRPT